MHCSSIDIDDKSSDSQTNTTATMTNINLQHYPPNTMNAAEIVAGGANIDPSPLIGDDERHNSAGVVDERVPNGDDDVNNIDNNMVHAPTWRHPITSTKTFFVELSGFFGWKFLSWLAIDQCCVSGGVFCR